MTTRSSRRRRIRILVVVGFSALLLAPALTCHYNRFGPNISPGQLDGTHEIVIAKVEILRGLRLTAEHLTVAQFPRNVTPEGTFQKIDDKLVGRVVVTRISPREPLTEARLAPIGSAGGLSSVIPEGYRAMTVKVDDVVGISGFIKPGTLVDVVVVISPAQGVGQSDMVSKIVMQNITVLASGQNLEQPRNEKEAERVRAVTLQVTPEQAEKLALATGEGKLKVIARQTGKRDL